VEEVGKRYGEKEENEDDQVEGFLLLVNHLCQNITRENEYVNSQRGAWR
jgi:hypothetical protein